jgi:hypothetical protein
LLLPAETATALVPRRGAIQQEGEPRLASMAQAAVQVYELDYHQNDESQGFFFALGDEAWSFGPWSSDARVLYCRVAKEKLAHLVVIGGTYVAWRGQPLLKAARSSAFFEWRKKDAVMHAPGDFSVTSLFEQMTSEELTGGAPSSSADLDRSSSPYAEKH